MPTPSEGDKAQLVRSLTTARERIGAQVEALARDLDQIFEASELVSTDDEHDPEGVTIAYERAQVTALLAQAREDLDTLDQALVDVRGTGHVRCEGCGEPIALERLLALPTARTCIRCAPR
jgi:RNA polymerase-binding transcription factor DksA